MKRLHPIVDFHAHIFPPGWRLLLAAGRVLGLCPFENCVLIYLGQALAVLGQ
ncbi:MAG: hypothetical protein HY676_05550 [Chloroflexi bacterium]|nr:hypothetical protein [Chloroflexota bacterium]